MYFNMLHYFVQIHCLNPAMIRYHYTLHYKVFLFAYYISACVASMNLMYLYCVFPLSVR